MLTKETRWVIDASMGNPEEMLFCLCPIEGDIAGDFTIITGMNLLTDHAPPHGKIVAIVHPDGQPAVNEFCERYAVQLEVFSKRLKENPDGETVIESEQPA